MKRLIVLCSLLWLICSSITAASSSGFINPRGDASCDSVVDISDINTIMDSILYGKEAYWCDINYDGLTDNADLNYTINILLGKESLLTAKPSGTVPVVWINVDNNYGITTKDYYQQASLYVTYPDGSSQGTAENPLAVKIKGRGNSTWTHLAKKPYKIKFPKDVPFLGMGQDDTFTLLPNFLDWWGYLQNTVGFELSRRLGLNYTPAQEPVEVVMNGTYIGLYFVTEQIKIGDNRIDIASQKNKETNPETITGGWLLEIENYPDSSSFLITEHDGRTKQNLWFTSHSPEKMSTEQKLYITDFLNNLDSLIYNSPLESPEWEKYIDVDELAKFLIVHEILDNKESFSGSCWMYKERGDSTKLKFGPVWDFGSCFINVKFPITDSCYNSFVYQDLPNYCSSHWIERLYQYPYFMQVVKRHWKQFYKSNYESIYDYMDKFVLSIVDAGNADYIRWPNGSSNNLWARKEQFFVPSIKAKVNWLNKQWNN